MSLRNLSLFLVLALVMAGCTAPSAEDDVIQPESITGTPGQVGGSVRNSAPNVPTFSPSATTGENRGGFAVVFTGTVFDRNTENQIHNITVRGVGPTTLGATHVVTAADRNQLTEPENFNGTGFKVWTGVKNDGTLHFKYRQTFPAFTPAGVYSFTARAHDTPGATGVSTAVSITLTTFSDVTISAEPINAAGSAMPGANWGEWNAEAGATNVAATNYLKLVNTGDVADARVVIDFDAAFVGAEDDEFSIPVSNNLQFAWAEAAPGVAPSTLTFNWLPANAEGSTTVQFSASDNQIFVTYRIVQMPDVLPVQAYGISFTVTEL